MEKQWSNLAKVIYKRTYSRPTETGTETWKDTVQRVINGNVAKYRGTDLLESNEEERLLVTIGYKITNKNLYRLTFHNVLFLQINQILC